MKIMKKFASIALVLVMMLAMAVPAMATTQETDTDTEDGTTILFNTYTDRRGVVAYSVTQGANPHFEVQYYAYLDRVVQTPGGALTIIDTNNGGDPKDTDTLNKGGKMPANGKGETTSPNDNPLTGLTLNNDGTIKTETRLTEIYESEEFQYQNAPGLKYFNIVLNNLDSQYTLKEIWILRDGCDPSSKNKADWKIRDYNRNVRFTNRPETAATQSDYILLDDGAVIRLVYDTKEITENLPANFYDYDISNGYVYRANATSESNVHKPSGFLLDDDGNVTQAAKDWRDGISKDTYGSTRKFFMYTVKSGINSDGNYTGSGAKLAFGNANTGTGLKDQKWNSNVLNVYSSTKFGASVSSYQGCTFGLTQGMNGEKLQYSSGVIAPKLFNEGTAAGKTSYDTGQYSLDFTRVGDTYTLNAVRGTGATNLTAFNHPTCGTTTHNHIWTNNFWPMDSAPSWGTDGHDFKFGHVDMKNTLNFSDPSLGIEYHADNKIYLPVSDDGQYHNSYFGMQYAVTFDLSASYIGPLEYYFFGDDDMWVFLDGRLVCDIGGVHSSVGEYVNLWDYIDRSEFLNADGSPKKVQVLENGEPVQAKDKNGDPLFEEDGTTPVWEMTDYVRTYTLSFFYTERGASGSTCWMQFTLPTVVGVNLDSVLDEQVTETTGALRIEKQLDGVENNQDFEFELTMKDQDNNYTPDNYMVRGANGELLKGDNAKEYIASGEHFKLQAGDVLVISGLPAGVTYTVEEISTDGYSTTIQVTDGDGTVRDLSGDTAKGTITANATSKVVYTNHATYELPATGGSGTILWYVIGLGLLVTALSLMYNQNRKVKKGEAA